MTQQNWLRSDRKIELGPEVCWSTKTKLAIEVHKNNKNLSTEVCQNNKIVSYWGLPELQKKFS